MRLYFRHSSKLQLEQLLQRIGNIPSIYPIVTPMMDILNGLGNQDLEK